MTSSSRHGIAAAASGLFAVLWTFPLVAHLSTHIPGPGAGDNVSFLWNFWWMRTALASGVDPFHTGAMFAPAGADLTLHTHTMLPAFAGATMLGALPLVAALNLTILAGLALNGFCAYLLAWRVTRDYGASLLGGLIFAGAPYFAGHLYGHFNLTMAWTIPLFAIATIEALRGSRAWAIAAGVVLGLTAYIDYYYVVFEASLAVVLFACLDCAWSVRRRAPGPVARAAAWLVAALVAIDLVIILAIVVTGGFDLTIAGRRLSLHTVFNPLQVLWLLVAVWLLLRLRPAIAVTRPVVRPGITARMVVMGAAFAVVAAPVVWHGVRLAASGEYVTQRYFWRSAPAGVDAATVLLGNPFGGVTRAGTQRLYEQLGIDTIEATAWLGIVPLLLGAFAVRHGWQQSAAEGAARPADIRTWTLVGAVFLVWAFGSHLMLFGANTGMVLPQAAMRYLPFLGNARIPGRAMVMVWLSLSVLVAIGTATWRPARFGRRTMLAIAAGAIVIDFVAAPIPLTALDRPPIYETLRDRPESGAVCELPIGLRDGFRETGLLDHRTLVYQTIHGRPMTGGFVARMPPGVRRAYEQDALIGALVALSSPAGLAGAALPDRDAAGVRLRANRIAFVMLNRRLSPAALIEYVEETLPLALIASDQERSLYAVAPASPAR